MRPTTSMVFGRKGSVGFSKNAKGVLNGFGNEQPCSSGITLVDKGTKSRTTGVGGVTKLPMETSQKGFPVLLVHFGIGFRVGMHLRKSLQKRIVHRRSDLVYFSRKVLGHLELYFKERMGTEIRVPKNAKRRHTGHKSGRNENVVVSSGVPIGTLASDIIIDAPPSRSDGA